MPYGTFKNTPAFRSSASCALHYADILSGSKCCAFPADNRRFVPSEAQITDRLTFYSVKNVSITPPALLQSGLVTKKL